MTGESKSAETVYADVRLFLSTFNFDAFQVANLNTYLWDVQMDILIGSCSIGVNHIILQVIPSSFVHSYLGGLPDFWLSGPQFQVIREWTAHR